MPNAVLACYFTGFQYPSFWADSVAGTAHLVIWHAMAVLAKTLGTRRVWVSGIEVTGEVE